LSKSYKTLQTARHCFNSFLKPEIHEADSQPIFVHFLYIFFYPYNSELTKIGR